MTQELLKLLTDAKLAGSKRTFNPEVGGHAYTYMFRSNEQAAELALSLITQNPDMVIGVLSRGESKPPREPWNVAEVTQVEYDDSQPEGKPNVFIQWKGTDVCFDFWCECGEQGHYDGFFAYAFRCSRCETIYEMPSTVYPLRVEKSVHEPVALS